MLLLPAAAALWTCCAFAASAAFTTPPKRPDASSKHGLVFLPKQRHGHGASLAGERSRPSFPVLPSRRVHVLSTVLCESATSRRETGDDYFLLDRSLYERMDLPDRANVSTHVIYGALLKESLVEVYQVYKNTDTQQHGDEVVVAVVKLGHALDGHSGVVHGGILALLIDDVLGFGYEALDDSISLAVTANLSINYTTPVPAGSLLWISAQLVSRQGRKLHWKIQVTSMTDRSVVYCQATSLYIIPRQLYNSNTTPRASSAAMP